MPIYEYVCRKNHRHVREQIASSLATAREFIVCPDCQGMMDRQQFSTPSQFQWGERKKGSNVGEAVKRVKKAGF
jgi:hypothetical protein